MKLLENGFDSFKKAIDLINEMHNKNCDDEFMKKDIIIMLHHSIEVLAKHCLVSSYGEIMIYEDFSKSCSSFNRGKSQHETKTISFLDAVNRLYAIEKREISVNMLNCYFYLNDYRNRITHYTIDLTNAELNHLFGKLVPELYELFSTHIKEFKLLVEENSLQIKPRDYEYDIVWFWKEVALIIENYFIALDTLEKIKKNRNQIGNVYDSRKKMNRNNYISYDLCPVCQNETFFSSGSIIDSRSIGHQWGNCELCGFKLTYLQALVVSLTESFSVTYNLIELLIDLIIFDYPKEINKVENELIEKEKQSFIKFYKNNKDRSIKRIKGFLDSTMVESIEENEIELIKLSDNKSKVPSLDDYEFNVIAEELESLYRFIGKDVYELIEPTYIIEYPNGQTLEYNFEFDRLDFYDNSRT